MFATWAFGQIDIRRELRWALEELHYRTGETALPDVLAGRDSVCIDSIPSKPKASSRWPTVGAVWPAHTSSSGLRLPRRGTRRSARPTSSSH